MMLQTEHERCDRVRAGWREVRRATFSAVSAIEEYMEHFGQLDAEKNFQHAQKLFHELASNILLYGKGSLGKEYQRMLSAQLQIDQNPATLKPIFRTLDGKAEYKCDVWRLRWL
jgi:hypothetical protein